MVTQEIGTSWSSGALVVLSSAAILVGLIAYVRLAGLRSFSKMSSFDFAVTVALGSLLAAVALSGSSLVEGLLAAGSLIGVQAVLAVGRSRGNLSRAVDNQPVLLMADGEMLDDNLRRCRITTADVRAKLREANVLSYNDVRAVVLETTGDISVLHGSGALDLDIVADVVGADTLRRAGETER